MRQRRDIPKRRVSQEQFREHLGGSRLFTGKLPPRKAPKDVALQFGDYIKKGKLVGLLPSAPPLLPAIGKGITFGMFKNDQYGDCTIAEKCHQIQIHSHLTGGDVTVSDTAVMEAYDATGVEQGLGRDDGRYMDGVESYLARVGIRGSDGQMHKSIGYCAVNWLDLVEWRIAVWLLGGVGHGTALPISAYYQMRAGKPWSCSDTNNQPGSWGGHDHMFTVAGTTITWAARQSVTRCFREKYTDECYGRLTELWVRNQGKAPNGFARDELVRDMQEING